MNAQFHKVIFSKRLGTLVAVGEHASAQGKSASGEGARGAVLAAAVFLSGLSSAYALDPSALPSGHQVAAGQVQVTTSGARMDIGQLTNQAIVNWQSFNVGSGASVQIQQPSATSVLLNRVVGNDMSQIRGQISANGQVVLVNPNGIVMGPTGRITASAFTASTFGISDANFLAGKLAFERNGSDASVVNEGSIQTTGEAGGYIALIGASVSNQGTIASQGAGVALASGERATVSVPLSGKVRLELDPAAFGSANVANSGVIQTEGGQVFMRAAAVVDAISKIADARVSHTGSIDTSGAQGGRVDVLADHGTVRVSGTVTTNSTSGAAGGDVFIGRDEQTNTLAAVGDASGAQIESKGGFVETSGEYLVTTGTRVFAKDWLLDPTSVNIVAVNTATPNTSSSTSGNTTTFVDQTPDGDPSIDTSEVLKSDIEAAINAGTSVTISTANPYSSGTGTITIGTSLNFNNTGPQNATLRLFAVNGITQSTGSSITATGSNLVHIEMVAEGRYAGNPAANANSLGITLNSAITTNGDVTLNGQARHTNAANASMGIGVNGWSNASIQARNISITGTSANSFGINYRGTLTASGNITQNGTSQNWVGVVSSGAVNATGNLSITGRTISGGYQGINIDSHLSGASVTLNGQSNAHLGVALANARSITSTVGDITITGNSTLDAGISVGSSANTTGPAILRSAQNMQLTGQGATNGIRVWFSSQLEAGNSSTPGSINMSGTAVTTSGQSGIGVDINRYPNAATLTASANINITGTVSGAGTGSGFKTTWSGQNGNGPSMTAGGDFTLRANNRAASSNTSATINADSGLQVRAGGNIVVQAETNNDNAGAIVLYSLGDMYRGNTSLVSTSGDILIQSNQGGIRFNNQQASATGQLTAITGRNITIDNTGAGMATGSGSLVGSGGTTGATIGSGSINASTGAITAGAGKGLSEGLNFADARSITASGQLHLAGASGSGDGIRTTAVLTGASITANGVSDTAMGINATAGSFNATSGSITLMGRNAVSGGRGMTLSSTVNAVGDINLSGFSLSTGDRHGMVLTNAVNSASGDIHLTGQTLASSVPAITITGASAAVSVSNGRSINVNANTFNLESGATLNAGTGTVNLRTLTAGNEIVVGGGDVLGGTLSSQKLGIANSELNLITAGRVVIGDINSNGLIQVTGATTTLASTGHLALRTGGTISVGAALTVNNHLSLQTQGGNIANTAAISGVNVSIDNTNGSIDSSTGAITVGSANSGSAVGISVGSSITATGNLNMWGASTNNTGINVLASSTLRGDNIQATGRVNNGGYGLLLNAGSSVITTGTSGDSLVKGINTNGGSNAVLTGGLPTLTAATGTTLTLWGDGTNTGDRAMRVDGGAITNGAVTIKGTSNNATALMLINGWVTANANSALTLEGTTANAGQHGVLTINSGGVALSNGARVSILGQNTHLSGTAAGVMLLGSGIGKVAGASSTGQVSITGTASSTATSTGASVQAGVTTDGNINIDGSVGSAAGTGVSIVGAVSSSGTGTSINVSSNHGISHTGSLNISGANGTGGNILITSTLGGLTGTGTIGTTTLKNTNVSVTQTGTSTFSGAINATNFTKAGTGALTLDSWVAPTPVNTNISNAYTVSSGSLSLSLHMNYAGIDPASVNVVNNATFSLSNAGNGFWRNTAFNFTGGQGGGTMNLLGNPIGASSTTNTFSTSGGATNTINGLLNANNANVDLNLAAATSGTTLLDGSYAALVFAQNAQGGFGLDNATAINTNGPGGLLFLNKVKATQLNVSSGTVQFGNGSAATAAATPELQATNVAIASGAQLIFNRAEAQTNASVFTGTGSLTQAGAGTLTLTGNSSAFAGSTTVNAGRTMAIGTNGNFGAAGSTLNLASATASVGFTNTTGTSTIGSTIGGAGTLSQSGAGTGVLTADNTYLGTTTVSDGTLQVGNGGSTGTLGAGAVALSNNADLHYSRSAATQISNTISGAGNLSATITGAGNDLSVTGAVSLWASALSWVSQGRINLSTDANLTVSQSLTTTNFDTNAIVLNAGAATNAGTSTGGDISFSGSGAVSVGTGGRATLYTGSLSGSTGLGVTTGNNRYNSDELTTNYTTALGSGKYAIYREAPTLNVRFNDASKTYDAQAFTGGTGLSVVSGLVNGDTSVTFSGISYSGSSQNAANAGTHTISGTALNSQGYSLSYTNGSLTINKANLVLSGTREYDANTTFAGTQLTATGVAGQTFTVLGSGDSSNLASKHVQSNQALNSLTGLSLGASSNGGLSNNYNPLSTTGSSVSVTRKSASVTAANSGTVTYNGSTQTQAAASTSGFIVGDSITMGGLASGTNAATYTSALSVTGDDATNYDVTFTQGTLTIERRDINLQTLVASDKVFDGNTNATITGATFSNLVGSETLGMSGSGTFADATIGNNKTVTVDQLANLTQSNGTGRWQNYNLTTSGSFTTLASITAVPTAPAPGAGRIPERPDTERLNRRALDHLQSRPEAQATAFSLAQGSTPSQSAFTIVTCGAAIRPMDQERCESYALNHQP